MRTKKIALLAAVVAAAVAAASPAAAQLRPPPGASGWGARAVPRLPGRPGLRFVRQSPVSPLSGAWQPPPPPPTERHDVLRPAEGAPRAAEPAPPPQQRTGYGGVPTVGRFQRVTTPEDLETLRAEMRARIEADRVARAAEAAARADAAVRRGRVRSPEQYQTPMSRVNPDTVLGMRREVSGNCPGGATCGNLRTGHRSWDAGTGSAGVDAVAVSCAAGGSCLSQSNLRAAVEARTRGADPRDLGQRVSVRVRHDSATATSSGRAPAVLRGPGQRLVGDMLDNAGLERGERQAARRAANARQVWQGGGEAEVKVKSED